MNLYNYLSLYRLMLIQTYTYHILILYYGVYTCSEVPVSTTEITERILVLRNMYLSYRSYTCFTDTGLPVGTTELILILSIREYP